MPPIDEIDELDAGEQHQQPTERQQIPCVARAKQHPLATSVEHTDTNSRCDHRQYRPVTKPIELQQHGGWQHAAPDEARGLS